MTFFQSPWIPEIVFYSRDLAVFDAMFGRLKNGAMTAEDLEAIKYTFSLGTAIAIMYMYLLGAH